jgi:hypothetical protein
MRNVVANRLSRSAVQWTQIYTQYNSGTYNNQNMVSGVLLMLLRPDSYTLTQTVVSFS